MLDRRFASSDEEGDTMKPRHQTVRGSFMPGGDEHDARP